ncbi:MAG: hypothetical protein LUC85_02070 [Bacteroidales bacterium]|nr:hypothetical protein [Bacteroidales bacterium]MCD8393605.1 hypothetical protein [Bacteroidales bacterium]
MDNTQKLISLEVLAASRRAWNRMAHIRQNRSRFKDFTYGKQWGDKEKTPEGITLTEEQLTINQGARPQTNNLIRQMVKTIIGRYRQLQAERQIEHGLKEHYRRNMLLELDSRLLEEFLISGCAIQRISSETTMKGRGPWVENVNPNAFFVNDFRDPRGWDVELLGMVHDWSLREVIMRFGHGDPHQIERLREVYTIVRGESFLNSDFLGGPSDRCRVIEAWTLESHGLIEVHDPVRGIYEVLDADCHPDVVDNNIKRRKQGIPERRIRQCISTFWRCRYLSPTGELLHSYIADQHPFVFKFYPLTDGEVHSFVEDIIHQQKHVNRIITMVDQVMRTSAKGALLYPVQCLTKGTSIKDISKVWSAPDAVIPYNATNLGEPHQITTSSGDMGAYNLLNLELQLLQDVSGVGDALLGKNISAAKGEGLYEAQVRNATIAISDLLETFQSLVEQRDQKLLKLQ